MNFLLSLFKSPPPAPIDYLEAFPDAEILFRRAYGLSDPAPELLNLIKAHPTEAAVRDLLIDYTIIVEENPSRACALASALVALRDSPDAPVIQGGTTFSPTNTYLTNCLLSGLSFKHDLTSSPDQRQAIRDGLDLNAGDNSSISELLVIGACIQLLTSGSEIVAAQPFNYSTNEIATKLRFQQSAGTVKDSNARRLLELTISHADRGFQKENDVNNVWELLFPSQHHDQMPEDWHGHPHPYPSLPAPGYSF